MGIKIEKRLYQPPKVKVVAFKVEQGFTTSNLTLVLPPSAYSPVSNDGDSFWGGNSGGSGSNRSYGSSGFSWGGGSNDGSGSAGDYSGFEWNW